MNTVIVVFLAGIAVLAFVVMIAALRTFVVRRRLTEPPIGERLRRIRARYTHKRRFAVHAVLYGVFTLAAFMFLLDPAFWHAWVTLPNDGDIFLIWLVWSALMLAHGVSYYFQDAEDRAVLRALDAEQAPYEKPKHDRLILTDDGEVLDVTDDSIEGLYAEGERRNDVG